MSAAADAAAVPAIAVSDLAKSFGEVEAVRGVSFQIAAGEVFGFLGPNGAGKTTIARSREAAVIVALGLAMLGVAIWEFSATE